MNVDHFFTIGAMHVSQGTPCEDYAWSGHLHSDAVFGVVSDGCSGACANTDIGARTISFALTRTIQSRKVPGGEWFRGDFFHELRKNFASLRLTDTENDYLATVVGFVATPETASVFLMGDGAIATRDAEGICQLIELDWYGNAPYYLEYTLRSDHRARFLKGLPEPSLQAVQRRTTTFSMNETGLSLLGSATKWLGFEALETGLVLDFKPQDQGLRVLAVMTDGISHIGAVPAEAAVAQFLAFKNTRGGFVKRRMRKALTVFSQDGHMPRDDIAVACVWMGDENGIH
ncbi:MAG: protein phosphatase 2C domain-containing protein [Deltaproteobacteria bacterium]|nr:protein phosphatase 2C domain-containing protein [Deltaproteobacteria bacterium]